jgi:hypothetical protein
MKRMLRPENLADFKSLEFSKATGKANAVKVTFHHVGGPAEETIFLDCEHEAGYLLLELEKRLIHKDVS